MSSKRSKKSVATRDVIETSDVFTDVYKTVYEQIAKIVRDNGEVDFSLISELIRITMEAIDQFSSGKLQALSGEEKSRVALKIIKNVIQDLTDKGKIPANISKPVLMGLDVFAPIAFKLIVDATKGRINLSHHG